MDSVLVKAYCNTLRNDGGGLIPVSGDQRATEVDAEHKEKHTVRCGNSELLVSTSIPTG